MKIVIATPLYPPEIGGSAPYVKELAKRLAPNHEVTIVTYGRLPEEIPGVHIIIVDKHRPLFVRLISYTRTLWKYANDTDAIYVQNGASVTLPAVLVSLVARRKLFVGMSDARATQDTRKNTMLLRTERMFINRADAVITQLPLTRPIIMPFEDFPTRDMETYEQSWETHIDTLIKTFDHAQ